MPIHKRLRDGFSSLVVALVAAFGLLLAGSLPASATIIGPGVGELLGPAVNVARADSPDDLLNGSSDSQERITDYAVDYRVQPDGTVLGKETINYTFPAGERRRGIEVFWPIRIQNEGEDTYRLYPMTITGVSSPTGAPAKYETQNVGQSYGVRIGDKDHYVERRNQTYIIEYTVKGTFNGFPDHQEFYVNPIGFMWKIPIDKATVTVTAPKPPQRVGCSAGVLDSDQPERCTATAGATSAFTTSKLAPGEGLTIAGFYPPGTVSDATPILRTGDATGGGGIGEALPQPVAQGISQGSYGLGVLVPALAALGMGLLVWRRGRDEQYHGLTPGVAPADGAEGTVTRGKGGPIAVRFEPPHDATPGLVGTLIDESADTRDVSATVVDLAVRGYLTIEEVETERRSKADWRLRRVEPKPAGQLLDYEETVYDGLFALGDDVLLSELKTHFATTLALTKKDMYREVVDRHWFRRSPEATRSMWAALAVVVAILGGILLFFGGVASMSIDNAAGGGLPIPSGVVLGGGVIVAAILIFVLGRKMPARTAAGSAIQAQTLGFRQYLETAEANQIRFEEAQSIFSRYLPYAIVFGCAERWAKVFTQVAEAAQAQGYALDVPTWYIFYGMHPGFMDFGSIANGMDDFATTAAGTFAATPGSSGESAFGGSGGGFGGGGGFSGGGGFGGGGGGSW